MTSPNDEPELPISALMRGARGSYRRAVAAELAAQGITDLPRSGGFVIAFLATGSDSVEEILRGLGVTKQALSQLVDALVTRGYVVRDEHPDDRRRIVLRLTERGRLAAAAVVAGAKIVDDLLRRQMSDAELVAMRKGLAVLGEIKASYGGRP